MQEGLKITAVRTFHPECPKDRSSAEARPRKARGQKFLAPGWSRLASAQTWRTSCPGASAWGSQGCGVQPSACHMDGHPPGAAAGSGCAALSLTPTQTFEDHPDVPELTPPPGGSSLSPKRQRPQVSTHFGCGLEGVPRPPELCRVIVAQQSSVWNVFI